ncbi:MAG: hypothetical protein LBD99_04775 [Candidatus Margulisbacteria bacterium]|jgi:hypothetical protein|nr:hypothetical protein [Candidatus Margulisiibacteriota bacterium]
MYANLKSLPRPRLVSVRASYAAPLVYTQRDLANLLTIENMDSLDVDSLNAKGGAGWLKFVRAFAQSIREIGTPEALGDAAKLLTEYRELAILAKANNNDFYIDDPALFFEQYTRCLDKYYAFRQQTNLALGSWQSAPYDAQQLYNAETLPKSIKTAVQNLSAVTYNLTPRLIIENPVFAKSTGEKANSSGEDYHNVPRYVLYQLLYLLQHPAAIFISTPRNAAQQKYAEEYVLILRANWQKIPIIAVLKAELWGNKYILKISSVYEHSNVQAIYRGARREHLDTLIPQ